MIISASRRTDIPTYYSSWFFNRLKAGFVLVRNPMNAHQVSNITLAPDIVDGIVFWTKNPAPMLERIDDLKPYTYYFQFTLNAYGKDVEPNIPSKNDCIIPTFQALAKKIGRERVIWRYDPIFFNQKYTFDYHVTYFERLCALLSGYTDKCTVSFLDLYKKTSRNTASIRPDIISDELKLKVMAAFSDITRKYRLRLDTCAEDLDFGKFGITHAHCIDKERFERIGSFRMNLDKDKSQRDACGCVSSVDIGSYNTCANGCLYCYANFNAEIAHRNVQAHDPQSPLLVGDLTDKDKITTRKLKSCKDCRISLVQG